jgi:hypothetical protein
MPEPKADTLFLRKYSAFLFDNANRRHFYSRNEAKNWSKIVTRCILRKKLLTYPRRNTLMNINFGFTDELTNTSYAPLVALFAHYQHHNLLQPLENVQIPMRKRDFEPHEKLKQVLLSILAGCETLSEVNPRLKHESVLARVIGNSRLSDQSSLSRTLDALTQKQIDELRVSTRQIWHIFSCVTTRDWRKYLWLDFDLTGLPCGALAEASQKGYFAEKKRSWQAISPCQCHF